jgi:predicted protein tyrosine phosphatase
MFYRGRVVCGAVIISMERKRDEEAKKKHRKGLRQKRVIL